ncbi:MAG: YihY/virulence factor BrkB family protein [Pedosphaera sp.]|nr:YihY/virulence factor BrkB family protein [Pedosphaera sp.]
MDVGYDSTVSNLPSTPLARLAESTLKADGPLPSKPGIHFVRFWLCVIEGFWRNRCQVRASALAYTTLLALVPLLAVSLSVASLLFDSGKKESEEKLGQWLDEAVANVAPAIGLQSDNGGKAKRSDVATRILEFTRNIHFGAIGVTSMVGLIFVAISLLRTIEAAFNDIWGVTQGRGWFHSVVLYWAVITLGPVVLLVGTTSSYLQVLSPQSDFLRQIPGIGLIRTSLLPLILLALGFGAFYILMPNTRVTWRAAMVGGLVASVLWWINNKLGALYNTQVLTYSAIYGSLGAIPLFLAGLYLSWLILLFGSQTAYMFQNRHVDVQDLAADRVEAQTREYFALRLMTEIGRRFDRHESPAPANSLGQQLGIPVRLVNRLLDGFAGSGLLVLVDPGERCFAPARPLERITAHDVLQSVRVGQGKDLHESGGLTSSRVDAAFGAILKATAERAMTVRISDLVKAVGCT